MMFRSTSLSTPQIRRLASATSITTPRTRQASQHQVVVGRAAGSASTTGTSSSSSSSSSLDEKESQRVASTYQWFQQVVIGQKLCPFAPPFLKSPELMRVVSASPTIHIDAAATTATKTTISAPGRAMTRGQAMELVRHEALALFEDDDNDDVGTSIIINKNKNKKKQQHETTLVILDSEPSPSWSTDFREFIRLSWDLQEHAVEQTGLMGKLQLVLFHPLATHQTYGMNDDSSSSSGSNPGDYTIRSPYPTIHLLREVDVLKAVQGGYPHLETLPARNQAKFKEQGLGICQRRLADCYSLRGSTEKYDP